MSHITTHPVVGEVGSEAIAAPDEPDMPVVGDGDDDGAPDESSDRGFTLVEILVAVVVVGILASVAVIGVQSLQRNGSLAACESSLDAANAASVAYYANSSAGAGSLTYPTTIADPTGADPAYLELPTAAASPAATGTTFHSAEGWTLEMTTVGTTTTPPVFACTITA